MRKIIQKTWATLVPLSVILVYAFVFYYMDPHANTLLKNIYLYGFGTQMIIMMLGVIRAIWFLPDEYG